MYHVQINQFNHATLHTLTYLFGWVWMEILENYKGKLVLSSMNDNSVRKTLQKPLLFQYNVKHHYIDNVVLLLNS